MRTKAEKLMPRRAASSFAASHRVSGMRRVTETWVPFIRKLLISVSSGVALNELLVAVGHLRPYPSKCNTNAFSAL